MKNQVTNNVSSVLKNIITPAAFACALMLSTVSSPVYANDKKEVVAASSPVQVKYLGEINKQPVIQIDINNLNQEVLYVTLKDENGQHLYSEKISGQGFSKKFQFTDQEANNVKLTLSLASKKDKKAQVFQINNVTTVVEDVVVTRVD